MGLPHTGEHCAHVLTGAAKSSPALRSKSRNQPFLLDELRSGWRDLCRAPQDVRDLLEAGHEGHTVGQVLVIQQ
jgi:hypothetical protein